MNTTQQISQRGVKLTVCRLLQQKKRLLNETQWQVQQRTMRFFPPPLSQGLTAT